MRDGPIVSTLLRLATPNALNLVAITLIITFDGIFVGALGRDALAGVSLVFPLVMLMQHMAAGGIGGGVSSAIARALGGARRTEAEALAAHAVVIALAMAALWSGLILSLGTWLYARMGASGAVLAAAREYSLVIFAGSAALWLFNTLANVMRGAGYMGLPAAIILGCAALHLTLSPALVWGWGPWPPLGVAGAATGFVVAFTVGTVACVAYLRSGRLPIQLRWRADDFRAARFWNILRVGLPGALNTLLTNLGVLLLTGLVARLSPETLAGFGVGARLEYIIIPLAFGFGTALVAMVGTAVGAGQFRRAERVGWTGAAIVGGLAGLIGVGVAIWPDLWLGMFRIDGTARSAATAYLQIVGPSYAFFGAGLALHFASQGAGRVVWPVTANAGRVLCAVLGGWLAFVTGAGIVGLCLAVAIAFTGYGVAVMLIVRAGAWRVRSQGLRAAPEPQSGAAVHQQAR